MVIHASSGIDTQLPLRYPLKKELEESLSGADSHFYIRPNHSMISFQEFLLWIVDHEGF